MAPRPYPLVCLSFLVVIGACRSAGQRPAPRSPDSPLAIATFQVDVTPPLGSPLGGGGGVPAKEIVDPLTARGVILMGTEAPIVLCAVDWIGIANEGYDEWRRALAEAAGTEPSRVAIHTLHQHDAPVCDFTAEKLLAANGMAGQMFDPAFAREAIARTADAVRTARTSPQEITHLGIGSAPVVQVASNRRVLGPDGKVLHTRWSCIADPAVRAAPEGLIDPNVQLFGFWSGARPVAVLSYYATHPQSHYGKGGVSADFVGMARSMREQELPGVALIHFDGAGGNVTAGKYNDCAPANRPVLARRLADGMKAAFVTMSKVSLRAGDVGWRVRPVRLPPAPHLSTEALNRKLADPSARVNDRLRAAWDLAWLRRTQEGRAIDLGALRLGPAMVLHAPAELFVEYQLAAEQMRPGQAVAMAAYGDYGPGYIGTTISYSQGGYETGVASRVAPAVEPMLMAALHELLE